MARAVAGVVGPDATLLEIGAGTGAIGCELARLLPGYRALDASPRMLEVFLARGGREFADRLIAADAEQRWPVADRSLTAVFGSRSLHLLDTGHVVAELVRVLEPGGVLLVGRVERDAGDPREQLRHEMRRRLAKLSPGSTPRSRRRLAPALVAGSAEPIERRIVARWSAGWTPREVLAAWRDRQPLSGVELGAEARETLLAGLERWAIDALGGLDVPFESEPTYTLEGARLPDPR